MTKHHHVSVLRSPEQGKRRLVVFVAMHKNDPDALVFDGALCGQPLAQFGDVAVSVHRLDSTRDLLERLDGGRRREIARVYEDAGLPNRLSRPPDETVALLAMGV